MYAVYEYRTNSVLLQDGITLEIIEITYDELEAYKSKID